MQRSRALISGRTALTDESLRTDHLKLCFLWYDEIIVEPIGRYDESRYIGGLLSAEKQVKGVTHAMSDVIRPLDPRIKEDITGGLMAQASRGYPRWGESYENYTYPQPDTAAEFAHNKLLERIAHEHGVSRFEDGYDIEQAEGRARVAIDAVTLWERLNSEIPCMLQANSDERAAMMAARQFGVTPPPEDSPFRLFEVSIPSLRDLTWSEVVEFRKRGSLQSLRQKIAQSVEESGADIERATTLFQQSEHDALDAIVELGRPRVKRVAFEAILANLPGLAVNPFSLFFGLRDATQHVRRQRDAGWFYLLRDIKSTANAASQRHIEA